MRLKKLIKIEIIIINIDNDIKIYLFINNTIMGNVDSNYDLCGYENITPIKANIPENIKINLDITQENELILEKNKIIHECNMITLNNINKKINRIRYG